MPTRAVTLAAALAAALLLLGCSQRDEEGSFCKSNGECREACVRFEGPEGAGSCRDFRREDEPCTRPGYTESDCGPGLRCSHAKVCVRGAYCEPGACLDGEECLSPDDYCVRFCAMDAECGGGCCRKLPDRAASICLSPSQCG